jgi:hypothetical protein
MALIIPPKARERLRASKAAADQLTAAVQRNKKAWTPEQENQLYLIFQVIKDTRDALTNIVEANP